MKLRNKKTGEILEDVKYIDTSLTTIEIHYLDNDVLRMKTEKDYHSFLRNWEDYDAPKEPLIGYEEIREIIRLWAKLNEITELTYNYTENSFEDIFRNTITFNPALGLEDGHSYTIDELCGEEEE